MKWIYRDIPQEVCPFEIKFARELKVPEFVSREVLAGKDARAVARALLAMTPEEFSAAFNGSPMKRAKLRGLKCNAAVVLGNIPDSDDVDVLTRALEDPEPLVKAHATWALERLGVRESSG